MGDTPDHLVRRWPADPERLVLVLDPGIEINTGEELAGKVQRDLLDLAYRNNWANILVNLAAGVSMVAMGGSSRSSRFRWNGMASDCGCRSM